MSVEAEGEAIGIGVLGAVSDCIGVEAEGEGIEIGVIGVASVCI